MHTREEAERFPRGNIELSFCDDCSFIYNNDFDPQLESYSSEYEETQGFSPTFNKFHRELADYLINEYDLHNKDIIEIGCGKGEFLTMLCELGDNRGVGFDPAYINERNQSPAKNKITFIKDFYSEKYSEYKADFICCKMTLEHIPDTSNFIKSVRKSIGNNHQTKVFFQIPDASRVFGDCAFWDIYYEHCSYFNPVSLTYLFTSNGFEVLNVWTGYDDQYLMIEAIASKIDSGGSLPEKKEVLKMKKMIDAFVKAYDKKIATWSNKLGEIKLRKQKAVIWGAGSKGVSFLTTLKIRNEIPYGVDINPYKKGTYMAGTGQEIISPGYLREIKPDIVIVMNPIYNEEIKNELKKMNLRPEIIALT
ncbi:MAG TPA: class I SAM-dependent methyltransferase [Balneolales bacterium]|nr:class I SAM-dependent methyltransferase [Balneolales bacterium]